jgi:hypothetical protein
MRNLIDKVFGARSRLTELEKLILDSVRERLAEPIVTLWDKQIDAINKVQRLPGGVEVDFYRIKNGRPSFDAKLSFQNKTTELLIAKVQIELTNMGKMTAQVWCIKGFLFSIEYEGNIGYFDKAVRLSPKPAFRLNCELIADLAST